MSSLSRRALACSRWRWLPDMRWTAPPGLDSIPPSGRIEAGAFGPVPPPYLDAVPDLLDPVTVGRLADLVREATGERVMCFGALVWRPAEVVVSLDGGAEHSYAAITIAEALVMALEACE